MTSTSERDIAVVIPARNEAQRIASCLTAIEAQMPHRVMVILVVNNTDDATATIARSLAATSPALIEVLDVTFPEGQGVGSARRLGAERARQKMPGLKVILNTDADCIVADDWVERNVWHLASADAVCGKIGPIEEEQHLLSAMDHTLAALEGRYRELVLDFYRQYAPDPGNPEIHHAEAAGASLGLRAAAYFSVGGFAETPCGEDRDIVRRLRATDLTVRYADDVNVRASLRLDGRAPGGMADALIARTSGASYVIDEALPPPDWLWQHRHALPDWPPEGSDYAALPVGGLQMHIDALENLLRETQVTAGHAARPTINSLHGAARQGELK